MFRHVRVRSFVVSLLLITVAISLPTVVGVAQSQLQLGNQSYARAAAPPLRMPVTSSVRFFRGVGGVAFSAVARGSVGQIVTGLRYDSSAPDGQRLVITVQSKDGTVQIARGQIYDWQLVPIAGFALDENGSAVTLFGELQDKQLENRTLRARGRVINYHPQLDNTLLGLRLFQADVLIIQPNAADLFKENGRLILGAGESGHNLAENQKRFSELSDWQDAQTALGNQYQSYVVGDLGQRVSFNVQAGVIAFTGEPFWNAWRLKYRTDADREKRDALEEAYDIRVDSYNALLAAMKAGKTPTTVAEPRLDKLRTEIDAIEKQVEELDAIEQMPHYSRALSQRIKELDGVNPVIYRTVKVVMHYRALFKHFQAQNQIGFSAFVKSLSGVPVRPLVTTPTIQEAPVVTRR